MNSKKHYEKAFFLYERPSVDEYRWIGSTMMSSEDEMPDNYLHADAVYTHDLGRSRQDSERRSIQVIWYNKTHSNVIQMPRPSNGLVKLLEQVAL